MSTNLLTNNLPSCPVNYSYYGTITVTSFTVDDSTSKGQMLPYASVLAQRMTKGMGKLVRAGPHIDYYFY